MVIILAVDTCAFGHQNSYCRGGPSINRENSARNPPRMVTREEDHRSRAVPACPFCSQETPRLPRSSYILTHTSSVHHWRVEHLDRYCVLSVRCRIFKCGFILGPR